MKIGLAMPIYLRGRSTNRAIKAVAQHYIRSGHLLHLCGSEGTKSAGYCRSLVSENVKYIEVPQKRFTNHSAGDDFLRKKFNDSLKTLPKDCDWFCLVGADDAVSLETFSKLQQTDKPTMAGVARGNDLIIYEVERRRAFSVALNYNIPLKLLPGLNAFNRAAMDACNWLPYQRNGCETGAELLFQEIGAVLPLPGHVIMVKEGRVLNSVAHIKQRHATAQLTELQHKKLSKFLAM